MADFCIDRLAPARTPAPKLKLLPTLRATVSIRSERTGVRRVLELLKQRECQHRFPASNATWTGALSDSCSVLSANRTGRNTACLNRPGALPQQAACCNQPRAGKGALPLLLQRTRGFPVVLSCARPNLVCPGVAWAPITRRSDDLSRLAAPSSAKRQQPGRKPNEGE